MNDARLTDELAVRVMGWRLGPNRYMKSGRSWITRSRFRPLKDAGHAIRLLDSVTDDYSLLATPGGAFTAEVRRGGRVARATGRLRARTISLAVARLIGLEVDREANAAPVARAPKPSASRSPR